MVKLIYSFSNEGLPEPLMKMFEINQSYHSHDTRQSLNPHIQSFKYKIVLNSFIHRAPELWSQVPLVIKNSLSKASFSKRLKKAYLFKLLKNIYYHYNISR